MIAHIEITATATSALAAVRMMNLLESMAK